MNRMIYRTICIVTALVLGLMALPTSFAQRPLPRGAATTDTSALELNESFESGALPTNWQVTGTPSWRYDDPKTRTNKTGGSGKFAIADSDNEGKVDMDTSLITPALDLSSATTVKLSFKTIFSPYETSKGDVDVSIDGGTTWTNLWRATGSVSKGTINLTVSQAAGQSNVKFRFRYYDANWDYYWQVDDVQVESLTTPTEPTSLSSSVNGDDIDLTWTDNSNNETNFIVEKSSNGTDWVEAGRVASNVTSFSHQDVPCGTTVYYRVKAINGALNSGYSNTPNTTMTACPPSTPLGINESFDAATMPAGWDETGTWSYTHTNNTGGSGNAAYAGVSTTSVLRTPAFNMLSTNAVLLKFKTDLKCGKNGYVKAEISQNGGSTWTSVWEKREVAYKGEVSLQDLRKTHLNSGRFKLLAQVVIQ